MKLAIIGDFYSNKKSHIATDLALQHSAGYLNTELDYKWLPTETICRDFDSIIELYNSFWIAPGGEYNDVNGVLEIIKYARIYKKPIIGTCAGFQHMVLEYARNVLEITDAEHAEYNPEALNLIITPLSCNIKGTPLEIEIIDETSKVFCITVVTRYPKITIAVMGLIRVFKRGLMIMDLRS